MENLEFSKSRRWNSPNQSYTFSNRNQSCASLSETPRYNRNNHDDDFIKQRFSSSSSSSASPIHRMDKFNKSVSMSPRTPKLYSSDEEEELSTSLKFYYDNDLNELLNTSFDGKSYNFNVRGAKLPPPEMMFTEKKYTNEKLLELQNIKTKLNGVKSKLNEYELTHWHKHTKSMNPADKVMRHLRRDVKVEFLTQAWCKFYELVNKYKLVPVEARKNNLFYSFHLCEAPGAFVASLNHYLKLNHPELEWYWKANSLNPYYEGNNLSEMINDDRFMLQTIEYWDFGPDMTGDITHPDYPRYLRHRCGDGAPHLVTADGSFDCQDKPEEQENLVSWLHLKETLNALNILRKGGNFVIKMFTFFECDTICLLTLLAAAFQEVKVEKPATSKEGNSEVYVVCQKFHGRSAIAPCLDKLLSVDLETYKNFSMFPYTSCNRLFYREITKCADHFAKLQMSVIERNIRIYNDRPDDPLLRKHCDFLQEKYVEYYIRRYKLRPIRLEDNIVKLQKQRYQVDRRPPNVIESRDRKQGSHNERVQRSSLEADALLTKITDELNDELCRNLQAKLQLPRGCLMSNDRFEINHGKPIEVVRSSQFCHGRFIRIRNEMINVYGVRKFNIAAADFVDDVEEDMDKFCDFTMLYVKHDNNSAQRESFKMIYHKLQSLREGDYLKLVAFPLLTQFNVNVLCVLRQMFKELVFFSPNTLILVNLQLDQLNEWMDNFTQVFDEYTDDRAIISFLQVSCVTGISNPFYKWVVDVNNSRLYQEIKRVIELSPRT